MKRFLAGFLLGALSVIALASGGVYLYLRAGWAPVATSARPLPLEKRLTRMALHARLEREMPRQVPLPADEANVLAGARVYVQHCAVCHGLPGGAQTAIAAGEFPKPPHLFRGKGVTDDPAGETYWKVANGIRLTGMPGFEKSLSTEQMWQVSLLLAAADRLPAPAKEVLACAREGAGAAGPSSTGPDSHSN
jgi:thiosulfate dehydrogenase